MSYYAIPIYAGTSCLLCLIYGCIECVKQKHKLDSATHSFLCTWIIVSAIVTSVVAGVVGEMTTGMTNITHILIGLILTCVTLSISSSMIYWS